MNWLKWNLGTALVLVAIAATAFWVECKFTDLHNHLGQIETKLDEIETLMTFRG